MSIEPGALVVVFLYGVSLFVVLVVSKKLVEPEESKPWWRNVRFWAAFVAVVQMVVYAVWS